MYAMLERFPVLAQPESALKIKHILEDVGINCIKHNVSRQMCSFLADSWSSMSLKTISSMQALMFRQLQVICPTLTHFPVVSLKLRQEQISKIASTNSLHIPSSPQYVVLTVVVMGGTENCVNTTVLRGLSVEASLHCFGVRLLLFV